MNYLDYTHNFQLCNCIDDEYENEDVDTDPDFVELVIQIACPRAGKVIRERPNFYNKFRDFEFLEKFRLTKRTADFLTQLLQQKISHPTTRNSAVTAAQKVLLTLRYYATGSFIDVCADFAGVHQSTAGKIIREVSEAIAMLRPDFVFMPKSNQELKKIRQEFYNIAKFPMCIGALDCTHIKIRSPGGNEPEIFRNRKNFFSINVQTISDAKLRIQNIVARWSGSSHDSNILKASAIKKEFDRGKFKNSVLVADSGYAIQKYIITPLLKPSTRAENLFNESQIQTRNPVERSYGVWKRRFPILSIGINVRLSTVMAIIVATAVLHNIALKFGDALPKPTHQLEELINLQQIENIPCPDQGSNRSVHRQRFLNYFSSLL